MELDSRDLIEYLSDLDKIALLLLHANNDVPIRDNLFYQKEFFLISNYILEIKGRSDFIPGLLGPYSEPAEISLKNLISYNLVDKLNDSYMLNDKGKETAEIIESMVSPEYREAIADFKNLLNDLTKDELLAFIYFSYHNFTGESLILGDVIKKRIPNIISLYKKDKISLAKAASLAGVCIEEFLEKLRARPNEDI